MPTIAKRGDVRPELARDLGLSHAGAVVVAAGEDQFTNVEAALKQYFVWVEPVDHLLVPVGRFSPWPRPPLHFKLYRAYGYHPEPTITSDRSH